MFVSRRCEGAVDSSLTHANAFVETPSCAPYDPSQNPAQFTKGRVRHTHKHKQRLISSSPLFVNIAMPRFFHRRFYSRSELSPPSRPAPGKSKSKLGIANFLDLPEELVLHVLEYLSIPELRELRLICPRRLLSTINSIVFRSIELTIDCSDQWEDKRSTERLEAVQHMREVATSHITEHVKRLTLKINRTWSVSEFYGTYLYYRHCWSGRS